MATCGPRYSLVICSLANLKRILLHLRLAILIVRKFLKRVVAETVWIFWRPFWEESPLLKLSWEKILVFLPKLFYIFNTVRFVFLLLVWYLLNKKLVCYNNLSTHSALQKSNTNLHEKDLNLRVLPFTVKAIRKKIIKLIFQNNNTRDWYNKHLYWSQ